MDLLLIMGTSLRVSPVSDMICERLKLLRCEEIIDERYHLAYIPQRVPIVSAHCSSPGHG